MTRYDTSTPIFDYTPDGTNANFKITHDIKHHVYRITMSDRFNWEKQKMSITVRIPEEDFPFKLVNGVKIIK